MCSGKKVVFFVCTRIESILANLSLILFYLATKTSYKCHKIQLMVNIVHFEHLLCLIPDKKRFPLLRKNIAKGCSGQG